MSEKRKVSMKNFIDLPCRSEGGLEKKGTNLGDLDSIKRLRIFVIYRRWGHGNFHLTAQIGESDP